jgi:hypothetical protein
MELENRMLAGQGGKNPLRQEVEQNYDNGVAEQMKAMEIFDYYKSMGGQMTNEEGGEAGWTPENVQMFNNLLNAEAPNRTSIMEEIDTDLRQKGYNTSQTTDAMGHKTTTVGGKND